MFRNPATDLIVALVIVLLIFGPKRLPSLGKSLGHGIREFKDGITGKSTVDDEDPPALNAAQANPTVAPNTTPVEGSVPVSAPAQPPPASTAPERESAEVGSTEQRA
jgi:sec-independent protein translocase protein TatA